MTGSITANIVFGLVNFEQKYLTAEKFGNQTNVTGNALRSKQIWTFESLDDSMNRGYLKSWQGKYLESNKNGNVICVSEDLDDDYIMQLERSDEGEIAFKDIYGKYLAGNNERLYTTFKLNKESLWSVHFTIHPQCNIKSVTRKRYVSLYEKELHTDDDIPWGTEGIITLTFKRGKYTLQDSFGRYLNGTNGEMEVTFDDKNCFFHLSHLQGGSFAFRCSNGKYLTVHGPNGKLIASKSAISKDELFIIEPSKAQVVLTACNEKMASTKQGIDVTANQMGQVDATEIFQLGYHLGRADKITFLARSGKYWFATEKSITASSDVLSPNCVFKMEWNDKGTMSLKAFNNKYISSSSGGQLAPCSDVIDSSTRLVLRLFNRPKIILRGEYGYLGMTNSNRLQCNLGSVEMLQLVEKDGKYLIKTMNGMFLKVDADLSIVATVKESEIFSIELHSMNKLQVKASNGQYLEGNSNGTLIAGSEISNRNTLWEY